MHTIAKKILSTVSNQRTTTLIKRIQNSHTNKIDYCLEKNNALRYCLSNDAKKILVAHNKYYRNNYKNNYRK